jgi:hypothetical protein
MGGRFRHLKNNKTCKMKNENLLSHTLTNKNLLSLNDLFFSVMVFFILK